MRILFLHNQYQIPGGEDAVVKAETELLRDKGHVVDLLTVDNDVIDGVAGRLLAASAVLYSRASRDLVDRRIKEFKPDVVHAHNLFPLLSPAVFDACRANAVPVVQTLHNYRLVCPSATLFRDRRVCEECLDKWFPWPAVEHRCYRNSALGSVAVSTMIALHRSLGTWENKVDMLIALTNFQKRKLASGGIDERRIVVKPNFVPAPVRSARSRIDDRFALFVGRLSEEKGLDVVLRAYREHELRIPLMVVGDGPLTEHHQSTVSDLVDEGVVTFLGRLDGPRVLGLMQQASLLLFPSVWYEGFPMTILEAFSCGLPVLASDIGGLPEIVQEGVNGWLASPGNVDEWAEKMRLIFSNEDSLMKAGRAAQQVHQEMYSSESNYSQLMAIYGNLIANGGREGA